MCFQKVVAANLESLMRTPTTQRQYSRGRLREGRGTYIVIEIFNKMIDQVGIQVAGTPSMSFESDS